MATTPSASTPLHVKEALARRLCLVRACENGPTPAALWSPEDRAWATRLARETAAGDASPARFLAERARHAGERLFPRDARLARDVAGRAWRWSWPLLALALGTALGLGADSLDPSRRINLLAPPLWALLAWNAVAYALIALNMLRGDRATPLVRGLLARWMGGRARGTPAGLGEDTGEVPTDPRRRFRRDWAAWAAPLTLTRAVLLLHLAAAGLALGLIAGLYLRGLAWDYRVGWESTFLDPTSVHALLSVVLKPAEALTGIAVPGAEAIAAMQVLPGSQATTPAGPWLHLLAATLALFIVVPRLALAAFAFVHALWRSQRMALPAGDPYFQRLLLEGRAGQVRLHVQPSGRDLPAAAVLGLRSLVSEVFGEGAALDISPAIAYGDEERAATALAGAAKGPPVTLQVACVDLGATPESETHGRLFDALRAGGAPLLVLADPGDWSRRFASMPERLTERRAAWRGFAAEHGGAFAAVDLAAPQLPADARAISAALGTTSPA